MVEVTKESVLIMTPQDDFAKLELTELERFRKATIGEKDGMLFGGEIEMSKT